MALRPGSRLTVRGHPRDLVHLMVNGVMLNEPIYNLADLGRNFGSWALRDAEFEFTEGVAECEAGHRHDLSNCNDNPRYRRRAARWTSWWRTSAAPTSGRRTTSSS